jgi:hypothetical protein
MTVLPSGRIHLRLLGGEHDDDMACGSPWEAIEAVERYLAPSESWTDEFALVEHSPLDPPTVWFTHCRAAALYWCAAVLAKTWPPRWIPLIERRGTRAFAGEPPFEPPLIERREEPPADAATRST